MQLLHIEEGLHLVKSDKNMDNMDLVIFSSFFNKDMGIVGF